MPEATGAQRSGHRGRCARQNLEVLPCNWYLLLLKIARKDLAPDRLRRSWIFRPAVLEPALDLPPGLRLLLGPLQPTQVLGPLQPAQDLKPGRPVLDLPPGRR